MAEAEKKRDQTFPQVKKSLLYPPNLVIYHHLLQTHHYTHIPLYLSRQPDFDFFFLLGSDNDGGITGEGGGERSGPWPLRRARVSSSSHRHFSCNKLAPVLI